MRKTDRRGEKRGRPAKRRQTRPTTDDVWLSGRHLVRETIIAGKWPLARVVVERTGADADDLAQLAAKCGVRVETAARDRIQELAGHSRHQGVVAQAGEFPYSDLETEIAGARDRGEEPLVLLLCGLHDPHNAGAILRSAEAAGVTCVVIQKRRQVGITAVVARTSAGAVNWVPVARVSNLNNTLNAMKRDSFWLFGASEKATRTIHQVDLTCPIGLVVGGEGDGLRALTAKLCDELLAIPMGGKVASLNASVAAGVMLFEAVRQRREKSGA